ncbi:MAG: GTP-binding protein [Bacteroidota bacterium]
MPSETNNFSKPTTILTGFLGAGKTTFLNHLISNNPDKKYAIIENEYGEQSIDSDLILRAEGDIVELNNGCLCCTLNENLYEILNTLFDKREEYDEVIIEATGVANPVGLVEPFIIHPAIKEYFPISNIICMIDAELIEEHLAETEEAIGQITFSDVLLINKTDLVDEAQVAHVKAILRELNPLATILEGNKTQFPEIAEGGNSEMIADKFNHNHKEHSHPDSETSFPVRKKHTHHHHEHTKEINSFVIEFDRPFNYQTLYHQLNAYLVFQSQGLYRMKGLVWVQDSDKAYIVQSVGKRLDLTEYPGEYSGDNKQSRIVFIGKNLQKKSFERLLNRCFA